MRWAEYVARTRWSYPGALQPHPDYELHLQNLFDLLNPDGSDLIGLFPIAHEDQTAFIVCRPSDSAIFFDIGQAALIKSAFSALRSTDPETTVFKLFLGAATLRTTIADRFLADKLGDCLTEKYVGPRGVDGTKLNEARGTLSRYTTAELQGLFHQVVDGLILAHELYHYQIARSQRLHEMENLVASSYDALVAHVTDDESMMATDSLTPAQRALYASERQERREWYIREKDMITEEIACDLFAFTVVAELALGRLPQEVGNTKITLEVITALHAIAFSLLQLHQAVLERVQLFVSRSPDTAPSARKGLYNLRRAAVGVLASHWCAEVLPHDESRRSDGPGEPNYSSEWFQHLRSQLYIELSHDVLVPAMPRLGGCFELIDRTFPVAARSDPVPTVDPSDRLFLSALPFRIDDMVANECFATGAAGLRNHAMPGMRG